MKKILIIIVCFQFGMVFSQDKDMGKDIAEAKQYVAEGNEVLVRDGNFPKAEGEYRKAIAKNPVDVTAKYNLANAYYATEKYDEATQRYTETAKIAGTKAEKHKAFHNQGNTYMEQKKFKEAVEAYKNALRNNPKDDETRYNLALAKKMLEQQQKEQDQNKDKDKDKKDQDKDKEGDNKDKKDEEGKEEDKDKKDKKDEGDQGEDKKDEEGDKKEDKGEDKKEEEKGEDEKDGKGGKPKEEQEKPQQVQGQLSPQQVKSLLEAMNNEEKKVQDKINAKKVKGAKTRTDKDW